MQRNILILMAAMASTAVTAQIIQYPKAEKVGTTKSGISRIESGGQNITLDVYYTIADALEKQVMMVMGIGAGHRAFF